MKALTSLPEGANALEPLPLSLLNDFLYCPRRAALKAIEGWRGANEHTVSGDIVHEHADLPGYEVAKGVTVLRALPVWSERLGLSGKCDVVEVQGPKSKVQSPEGGGQSLKSKVQSLESEQRGGECGMRSAELKSELAQAATRGLRLCWAQPPAATRPY